jgi:DNA-binding NtrC family response regulator
MHTEQAEKISKANLSILLIDDDEDDRELFVRSVKEVDEAIICHTSSDCMQGLKFLADSVTPPDYIFLDLRMPGYSGKRCLEEIRKQEKFAQTPVIIYTTSNDVNDAHELREMGAVHFISKPTNPSEIYYLVSTVINENWTLP